ncbi:2-C-METHYL-D-ERYTHRITOL 4-PHOSPHATE CYTIDYLYLTRANSFERASE [Salix koriyanagi]|uniref:2-C-METHYL-D-ERYTHRITOL 4-PHOSPHATE CYTIDYLYLTRANSFERASE n=1 Tax=Salix koriyanagi TaxID=2511006 RepID=A0A9Q0TFH5_9ROSI|nr:2-C-METHYL-D-ERYTHRITOL 4-PHOSPHATE CYTIDYLYLTRANSFERASE [Salix koriyanagi]
MRMRGVAAILWLTVVAAVSRLSFLHASSPPSTTVPAFLWSPHHPHHQMSEVVNYQTISSKDLARSVLSEGGWSNLLCSEKKVQQSMDLALVFVGRGLLSTDVSTNKNTDSALVNLLKVSYTKSNFSMAFPYVAASEEAMENSLVSGFAEACGQDLGTSNVAFSESCSVEGENFQKLANLHAINDYLASSMEKRPSGHTDLVVFCYEGSNSMKGLDQPQSESEIFSELISSVEMLGAKYSALYVSDPFRSIQLPYHQELERFLAESAAGNASMNSTHCDEVCQIKSSLLEGVLVLNIETVWYIILAVVIGDDLILNGPRLSAGFKSQKSPLKSKKIFEWPNSSLSSQSPGIVLLIILISGLCCMMGIDTPTRFEAPQDS